MEGRIPRRINLCFVEGREGFVFQRRLKCGLFPLKGDGEWVCALVFLLWTTVGTGPCIPERARNDSHEMRVPKVDSSRE